VPQSQLPSSATGVQSVTAGNSTVVIGGSQQNPTVIVGLDSSASDIAALGVQSAGSTGRVADAGHVHPMPRLDQVGAPTAAVSLNGQKFTSVANGSASTDGAAFGQIPVAGTTAGTYCAGNDSRLGVRPYAPVTLTYGATVTTDVSQGTLFRVTLAGNATLANPINVSDGERVIWQITQDSTGNRALSYGGAFDFGAAGQPTLSTTAGKTDYLGAIYRAASSTWDVVAFQAGY
jgi:hypothetical protein